MAIKKTKKLAVAVLMGGPSAEHEVSLATGKAVLEHLDKEKYSVRPVFISKKGDWFLAHKITAPERALEKVDVVFNALHGEYGEDGRLQAMLEYLGLPYTGSGIIASALGMDKFVSRNIFSADGLLTPKTFKISKGEEKGNTKSISRNITDACGKAPWVVKPSRCGSSVGVSIVNDLKSLGRAISTAFKFDDTVLVENRLVGTEITVPVLEASPGGLRPLPIIEIRPKKAQFFSYQEKYNESGAEEIVPAKISSSLRRAAEAVALKAHRLLDCRGYSRADIIISRGKPYLLEINTLPGLTGASLLPKAAKKAGIAFPKLLDILLADAL